MVNLEGNNNNNDMSMEDILASIRKYVSEDDIQKSGQDSKTVEESSNEENGEIVIKLDESQVIKLDQNDEEKKHVVEESNTKNNPFNKLATALKEYGRPRHNEDNKSHSVNFLGTLTVDKFFVEIATPIIKDWIANNMEQLVERVIEREIEKLKNQ